MKPKRHSQQPIVDQAIRSIRQRPVPAGPPAEVLSKILRADADNEDQPHLINLTKRRVTMKRIATTTVAATIIVGLLLGFSNLMKNGTETIAFADVLDQMKQIKTVTWTMTETHEVSKKYNPKGHNSYSDSDITERYSYKAPGHVRSETSIKSHIGDVEKVHKSITIRDVIAGKYLFLDPDKKVAQLPTVVTAEKTTGEEAHWVTTYLIGLKKKVTPDAESLGKKAIGGHDTIGFRVRTGGKTTDIWVDAKTKNLVLVVTTEVYVFDRVIYKTIRTVRDIEFDRKLDDSLFSLDIPKGYKKSPQWELTETVLEANISEDDTPPPPTEKDLIDGLLLWAVVNDETFPAEATFKIDDAKQAKDDNKHFVMNMEERHRAVGRFVRRSGGDRWHYAGEGVKLDDKDSAVCWYRPKDSKTYRVIYGDLSVRDVAREALPKRP